jgi:acetylglutamate kinase
MRSGPDESLTVAAHQASEGLRSEKVHELAAGEKAAVLAEALPYIRRFWGKIVVVKYGGNAMDDERLAPLFAEDIVLMRSVGLRPVVVHGGGPQIGDLMNRLGKTPEFSNGLRVTDAETLDIARMVLVGRVNRDIVSSINVHGPLAVGLSGEDAQLISAVARSPELGFVGDVENVNAGILERLLSQELIPVVATIGADVAGQSYNINADTVAGAIAEALSAERLVYLTNVEGLRKDVEDPASRISSISAGELDRLLQDGAITEGMIPKLASCVQALRNGVRRAHILDGRVPHVLLLEFFTDEGVGTMVEP